MAAGTGLPADFDDLSKFVPDWMYASERDRNAFRVTRSMAELRAFYDATLPRLEAIANFLNDYPLDAMPRDCANLLELALMTMEVAPAIEYYDSPDVPNSVAYERFEIYPLMAAYSVVEDAAATPTDDRRASP